jgi:hypothetical protein
MGEMGAWRSTEQLAQRVGGLAWLEGRLFEVCGAWATDAGSVPDGASGTPAEIRVFLAGVSRHHAELAAGWQERLPVRAGVDRAALVVAPPGPAEHVFERLEAGSLALRLFGLVEVVLPRLLQSYREDVDLASPVAEGPVIAVLRRAIFEVDREVTRGSDVIHRQPGGPEKWKKVASEGEAIQRLFDNTGGIFPAAWAS